MKIYTVHVKPSADDAYPLERQAGAIFVPEGFSIWAFLFQVLWALYHRLWLVALLMFVALVVVNAVIGYAGLSGGSAFLVQFLVALLIGAEAQNLRRWTLKRRGYELRAVVAGDVVADAEHRYFGAAVQ